MGIIPLMKESTMRLLYLGKLSFGVLKWQPRNPVPVQTKPNLGQFKIIEEYTLDNQSTLGEGSTPEHDMGCDVETSPTMTPIDDTPPNVESIGICNSSVPGSKQKKLIQSQSLDPQVETDCYSVVSNHSEEIQFSKPPTIKKRLQINLPRLDETEIDVWTGKVHTYFNSGLVQVETDTKPAIMHRHSESQNEPTVSKIVTIIKEEAVSELVTKKQRHDTETSPEELLAHANALINRVSKFITKPVDAKYGGKHPNKSSKVHVEPDTSENLPVETDASPTTLPTSVPKPVRTVKCRMCKQVFDSVKSLNVHHREDHEVVQCDVCDKFFETPTALERHKYNHGDRRFVCEDCGQSFPFNSRLMQHRVVHQSVLNFMCE